MELVLSALRRTLSDLFTPRMLALLLWPMGAALLFWGGLALLFGATWKLEIMALLSATPAQDLMHWAGAEWVLAYAAWFVLILLWLPAVYLTALLITALVLMPIIVNHVAARHYPTLARRHGVGMLAAAGSALAVTVLYIVAWVLLLPLWLFAPFGFLVSVWLNAWLNLRLFMLDTLADHADADELAALRQADLPAYLFSAGLGLLYFVPILNFVAPVTLGLAFSHYNLERLSRLRAGKGT